MNTIQKTAIIGAVVVVGAGGMYYLGVNHADASLGKLLSESQSNQIIAE